MPFWDAGGGESRPGNEIDKEVNHRVCAVLKSFVPSRLARYPNTEFLIGCRDALYAYFRGAQQFLGDQLDFALAPYKQRLTALDPDRYLHLICALQMEHLLLVHAGKNQPAAEEESFHVLTGGAAEIYGHARSYVAQWCNQLDWFSDPQHGPARIVVRAYEEIEPIVGSPPPSRLPIFERLFWSDIELSIAERAQAIYSVPHWRQLVDTEMAAH